jgi:D-amino-acid dehydrogenase
VARNRPESAIVIGGGVIGLCAARELSLAGLEVTLLEADRVGSGASHGNGGWITPSLSTPLAAPGALRMALSWMFRRDSPFTARPRISPIEVAWYLNFLRSCSARRFNAGLAALLALNAATFAEYDRLRSGGVRFEMHQTGLLFAARTRRGLEHATHLRDLLADAGCAGIGEALNGDAIRRLEPAFGGAIRGGFSASAERHVRPDTLVAGLASWLREAGASIEEECRADGIESLPGGRWAVRTSRGATPSADRLLIAAGPASLGLLGSRVNRWLRLLPAKGYSVTTRGSGERPKRAAYLVEARVGCSPFQDAVRLAGTLELGARRTEIAARRMAAVAAAADDYYASWRPTADGVEWAGLRTLTSDALPLLGEVPGHPGLHLASGHGLLGVTLAPVTGVEIAKLMVTGRTPPVLTPFSLGRFNGRGRS